jgi:ABC-type bacteriocin/lantibiotic exporter with double-glycine peptidase domain
MWLVAVFLGCVNLVQEAEAFKKRLNEFSKRSNLKISHKEHSIIEGAISFNDVSFTYADIITALKTFHLQRQKGETRHIRENWF